MTKVISEPRTVFPDGILFSRGKNMSDKIKTEDAKYPLASHMEELGAATAEAICAGMKAANDDAPSFGPLLTTVSSAKHIDANALAHALTQLSKHKFAEKSFVDKMPAPFFKGKFMQNYRVILGKDDK
jgi:hypothetical protein